MCVQEIHKFSGGVIVPLRFMALHAMPVAVETTAGALRSHVLARLD